MSVPVAASSRRASLNQRITRRRTRSVSVARSAWVIDRTGSNAGGPSHGKEAALGQQNSPKWRNDVADSVKAIRQHRDTVAA
jgi:hypothetical protein